MSRFNTGNPLGSNDPRDLDDNAKNMDLAVNSDESQWVDRFGRDRKSFEGMEREFSADQSRRESEFDADQAARESEFQADQTRREDEFDVAQSYRSSQYIAAEAARNLQTNEFIANHGNYVPAGDYAAGIEITQYNQVVRDALGEFWRLSGSRELPYTTTGSGLPEGGAFVPVGDAALRQQLAGPAGYRLVSNQMAASAYGAPAKAVNVRTGVDAPAVVDYFHGYFWGTRAGNIERSPDGVTWEVFAPVSGFTPGSLIPTSDGEVISRATNAQSVYKSEGWSTGSPTWKLVLQNPSPGAAVPFTRMAFDGYGSKFIIAHYGAGSANWANSRYVWISTDAGETWEVVWDTEEQFPGLSGSSHIHGACYDPWADRFYFAEGHDTPSGVYYSDDDGANWTKVPNFPLGTMPTTMTAAEFGIVMGTDSEPNGVVLLPRTATPDGDDVVFLAANETAGRSGTLGFADRSMRDPDTGIVYVAFNSSFADVPVVIFGVGSGGASVVLREGYGSSSINRFSNVVAAKGRILATHNIAGNVVADLPPYTSEPKPFDTGNIMPEARSTRQSALAVGRNARSTGLNSLAIGATVTGNDSVAIGFRGVDSVSNNSTAVGNTSSAGSNGTAVGYGSTASNSGTAYGYLASAGEGETLAVGNGANAIGGYAVSVGRNAAATAAYTLSLGTLSSAGSSYATSAGYQAVASGDRSTALGARASSTGAFAVAVGDSSSATGSSVSVGWEATSTVDGVAVGRQASAASWGVSIGREAVVESQGGIAIGRTSKVGSNHGNAVAIGNNSETQRLNSICVGNRDIESTRAGGRVILRSPDGTAFAITVSNTGVLSATAI